MALDIYFRENIARVLAAIDTASGRTAAMIYEPITSIRHREGTAEDRTHPPKARRFSSDDLADHVRVYRQGYRDALSAVALAFGILPVPGEHVRTDPFLDAGEQVRLDGTTTEPAGVLYERDADDERM